MENFFKRAWAEIDLDAIKHNYLQIRQAVNAKSKIMCIVKADAYGHGAVILAKKYEKLGADWFGVSNIEEALQLRQNGILKPILILGYTPVELAEKLSKFNISQAVFSSDYANNLFNFAKTHNIKVKIHLKIDTGMSRIGFVFKDKNKDKSVIDEILKICKLDNFIIEGIFTHFSVADEPGASVETTKSQFDAFKYVCNELKNNNIDIKLRHCSNSGAILNYPETCLDMVRAGIILYGLFPSNFVKNNLNLIHAMSLKTVVSHIKTLPQNTAVSYGGTYITPKNTKIATVTIGYADGYLRAFSNKAHMIVNGKYAKVLGRVCMDQTMLDVSDIGPVKTGTIVTVFGNDKNFGCEISVDSLAKLANTINYEILCAISKRVPRLYIKNGQKIKYAENLFTVNNY